MEKDFNKHLKSFTSIFLGVFITLLSIPLMFLFFAGIISGNLKLIWIQLIAVVAALFIYGKLIYDYKYKGIIHKLENYFLPLFGVFIVFGLPKVLGFMSALLK